MEILVPGKLRNAAVKDDGEDQLDRSVKSEILRTVNKERDDVIQRIRKMVTEFVTTYVETVF